MAKYIVPPRNGAVVLIKCKICGALYAADPKKHPYGTSWRYECCPICNEDGNDNNCRIPLWKYNLIRYWRGLFNRDKSYTRSTDD